MSRPFAALRSPLLALAVLAAGAVQAAPPAGPTAGPSLPTGDMAFTDLRGQSHTLSELKGKVVLLDFWATWCEPCKRSLPLYNTWQTELATAGLRVVAASVDGTPKELAAFARELAPELTVWRDVDGQNASSLDLPTMPTAYLIGRDGKVLWRHTGFESSDASDIRAHIQGALDAR